MRSASVSGMARTSPFPSRSCSGPGQELGSLMIMSLRCTLGPWLEAGLVLRFFERLFGVFGDFFGFGDRMRRAILLGRFKPLREFGEPLVKRDDFFLAHVFDVDQVVARTLLRGEQLV